MTKPTPFNLRTARVAAYLETLPLSIRTGISLDLSSYAKTGLPTYLWQALRTAIAYDVPIPPPVLEYLHRLAGKIIDISNHAPDGQREVELYRAVGFAKLGRGAGAPIATYQLSVRDREIVAQVGSEIDRRKAQGHKRGAATAAFKAVASRCDISETKVRSIYRAFERRVEKRRN